MTLDLTKPMRVKNGASWSHRSGLRFWPTTKESRESGCIVGILDKLVEWTEIPIADLENIPEIVRIERWVNLYKNYPFVISYTEKVANAPADRLGNAVHLIFCHDPETGKTWAEVPEEDSCK